MTVDFSQYEEGTGLNYWAIDPVLQYEVRRTYSESEYTWAEPRLEEFGETVGTTIAEYSETLDTHDPTLHTYDRDGEVANRIEYHPDHFEAERLIYEAGTVADSFVPPPGRDDPMPILHNLAMEYLLTYTDIGLGCPAAMTAGVALVLDEFDDGDLEPFFDAVTARDYDEFLHGAMFLTEKQGGSDVGANETTAERAADGTWRLTGEKWFASKLDAGAALVLARREGAPEGTDGLSLFLLPDETRNGNPNNYLFRRLKDKLGTKSVPTGEVELRGAEAYLIGEPEQGFKIMAEMLNLERLSNAIAAVGAMGRAVLESKIHAANREAFGKTLDEHPLMRHDLVDMTVDHEAATAYTFDAARVYSNYRDNDDAEVYRLMRLLVPVAKHRTGRLAVETASYAMEILGGNGYVDDYVTNRLLRDVQVLPIWEGTSNILSLDLLRALAKEAAHQPFFDTVDGRLDAVTHPMLDDQVDAVAAERESLEAALDTVASEEQDYAELYSKQLADYVYDVYTAALLLTEAQNRLETDGDARKALVARRFVDRHIRNREARGITRGDTFPLDCFEAVVRFGRADPELLADAPAAD